MFAPILPVQTLVKEPIVIIWIIQLCHNLLIHDCHIKNSLEFDNRIITDDCETVKLFYESIYYLTFSKISSIIYSGFVN